jgi:hypothetical protein
MSVRLIKKGPQYNPNLMVLYKTPKTPKKPGFFKKIRKAITWEVDVWVVKCFFNTLSAFTLDATRKDTYGWTYGVVKERHDSLWVSNNGGSKRLKAPCVYMDDVCTFGNSFYKYKIPLHYEDLFVTINPNYNPRWYADGTIYTKGSNYVGRDIRNISLVQADALCEDYNN